MNTRNSVKSVIFSFDEASKEWLSNKIQIGNGMYKYICCQKTISGNICKKKPINETNFCKIHSKNNISLS